MEEICKELGITMSAAFNIFARKMIREKRIPYVETTFSPYEGDISEYIDLIKNL